MACSHHGAASCIVIGLNAALIAVRDAQGRPIPLRHLGKGVCAGAPLLVGSLDADLLIPLHVCAARVVLRYKGCSSKSEPTIGGKHFSSNGER